MKRRPGLKTCKNTEDTIKNDKEDKDGIPIGGIPSEKSKNPPGPAFCRDRRIFGFPGTVFGKQLKEQLSETAVCSVLH